MSKEAEKTIHTDIYAKQHLLDLNVILRNAKTPEEKMKAGRSLRNAVLTTKNGKEIILIRNNKKTNR